MKSLIECRDAELGVYYLRHASNMRHVRIALKGGRIVVSGPPCLSPAEAADIVTEKRPLLQRWLEKTVYCQDRSAILASPPSPSERSGEGEGGDEMR